MTARKQPIQLPEGSRAILEAAALLDEPFSVPLLMDLGFSADALDPLFDNGIFREPSSNRAEFADPELRSGLLGQMSWSRKRHLCEQFQTNIPGLFITSLPATQDFGPFFGFTYGVGTSAKVIGGLSRVGEEGKPCERHIKFCLWISRFDYVG